MSRRKLLVMALVSVMVVALFPTAVSAGEAEPGVYISLGTSLAAGTSVDSSGNSLAFTDRSYTDQLYERLSKRSDLSHVKLGCPGETTDQLLGGVNAAGSPSNCAALYATGSQIGDALATTASSNVTLITIDIGANDILQAQVVCAGDPVCITAAIPGILGNVGGIMGTLRAAGYDGLIVAMNYYNPQIAAGIGFYPGTAGPLAPDPAFAGLTDALTVGFNDGLAQVYGAFGVPVANVYRAFNAGDFGDDSPANGVWDNIDVVCRATFMCPTNGYTSDIHPTPRGYGLIAKTIANTIRTNS